MAKTAKKKTIKVVKEKPYTSEISKRFLLMIQETVEEGLCRSERHFLTSVGEYQQNLPQYLSGVRAPTLEQLTTACILYNYAPTWVLLGQGDKKLKPKDT